MERPGIRALCLIAVLAMGVCTVAGQTNGPAAQKGSYTAAGHGTRAANVRPNASNGPYVPRGPASVGPRPVNAYAPQMASQHPVNLRQNYSPLARPLNPTLAAMRVRQSVRIDNGQPNRGVLPRREGVRTDDVTSTGEVLAKREISGAPDTIDSQRIAKNDNVQPIARDLANHESKQHKAKGSHQNGRNRFSYSDALRHNWHEWHNRDWWKQHCNTIVFVNSGYYFLNAGYWYPAWGYDPLYSYYDYDGPIYTYGNLLPDQVIANVQAALQEAGYYFGSVTGSLSVETRAALANYQRDQGLIITGAIDEPTVEALGLY